jgi:hypothetical protein
VAYRHARVSERVRRGMVPASPLQLPGTQSDASECLRCGVTVAGATPRRSAAARCVELSDSNAKSSQRRRDGLARGLRDVIPAGVATPGG